MMKVLKVVELVHVTDGRIRVGLPEWKGRHTGGDKCRLQLSI